MIAYWDTNVIVWLAHGSRDRLSSRAQAILRQAELVISPMVLLEIEYQFEIQRVKLPSRDLLLKLENEIGLRVCDLPFGRVVNAAVLEKWTRDPFDRIIVSNAKANGLATLVSADERILANYPKAIW